MTKRKQKRAEEENPFIKALEWAGLLAGVLLIGSCTVGGFLQQGVVGGLGGFGFSLVFALFLVGWVFLIARLHLFASMSKDIKAIRDSLERQAGGPGDSGGAGS